MPREDWLRIFTTDDSEGSPTTEHAINSARSLVGVPTNHGGIQIELHTPQDDLEIEIGPNGDIYSVNWSKK